LEARLERDAVSADSRYVLEVSSPGLDRPLRRAADWQRFIGRKAMVKSAALGGRVEIEIGSVEGPEGSEVVMVRDAAGVEHRIALAQVDEARLSVHWS
jgi:ribosome maturation factor RimP